MIINFLLWVVKYFIVCFLACISVFLFAYIFNYGWQAGNYNFWRKKIKTNTERIIKGETK